MSLWFSEAFHSIGVWMDLKTIAELAGVAPSTASMALAGKPGIASATRERVQAIAHQFGYSPDAAGRALATGRSHAIGFVSEHGQWATSGAWTVSLLTGLCAELERRGYHVMLFRSEPAAQRMPPPALRRAVDGMVVAVDWNPEFLARIRSHDLPVVAAVPNVDVECDCVRPDDTAGARLGVQHLLELGHRRIGYVGTRCPQTAQSNRARWRGYVDVMSRAELPIYPDGDRIRPEPETVADLFAERPPTALLCCSDDTALAVFAELTRRGLVCPRDVSVVGIDDAPYAAYITPRLTTIRLPYAEIGAAAARLLLERIAAPGAAVQHLVMPETMVVRDSTAPLREPFEGD